MFFLNTNFFFFGTCRLHQRKTKSSTGQTRTSHTVTYRFRNLHSVSRGSMSGCDLRTIFRSPSTRAKTIEQLSSSTSTPSPNGNSSRPTSPRNGSSSKGTPSSTFSRPFRSVQLHFYWLMPNYTALIFDGSSEFLDFLKRGLFGLSWFLLYRMKWGLFGLSWFLLYRILSSWYLQFLDR